MRVVNLRLDLNRESILLFIRDDADDGAPGGGGFAAVERDALPERIDVRKVEAGQCLVHDGHGCAREIGRREITAAYQTDAGGLKVAGGYGFVAKLASPDVGLAVDEEVAGPAPPLERQTH